MKKSSTAILLLLLLGVQQAFGEDDVWMIDKTAGAGKDGNNVRITYSRPDEYGEIYQVNLACDPSKKTIHLQIIEGLKYQAILDDAIAHVDLTFDGNPTFALSGNVGKTKNRIATQEFDLSTPDSKTLANQMQSAKQQIILKDQFFHDPYILKLTGVQAAGQALSDCVK